MTIWTPDISEFDGPRYLAIAKAIENAIQSGDLPAGARLPAQRDLAWKLGVTVGTVSRAYAAAQQRRLVAGEVGRGTYVLDPGHSPMGTGTAPLGPARPDDGILDMSRNAPTLGGQSAALAQALTDIAGSGDLTAYVRYMPTAGHPRHRQAGRKWLLRNGVDVPEDHILITSGAQQGISAAITALSRPGETILTESLTYAGLIEAAYLFDRNLVGVEIDGEGIRPDALERAAVASGAKFLIITPTLHNPTAAIMSLERRLEILRIAEALDLTILEDDVYGGLVSDRPASLASLAPERCLYVTSASKSMAAGLRVAWMSAPRPLMERLNLALHSLCVTQPTLPAQVAAMWIEDGTAERLTTEQAAEIGARNALADEILDGHDYRGHPAFFNVLLNLPAPWRAETFTASALARGVKVVPASAFAVGRTVAPHAVRVSLTMPRTRADLRKGLQILAELAAAPPPPSSAVI